MFSSINTTPAKCRWPVHWCHKWAAQPATKAATSSSQQQQQQQKQQPAAAGGSLGPAAAAAANQQPEQQQQQQEGELRPLRDVLDRLRQREEGEVQPWMAEGRQQQQGGGGAAPRKEPSALYVVRQSLLQYWVGAGACSCGSKGTLRG
jgi:hypothetical protein